MAEIMIHNHNNYEVEIYQLRMHGDVLLQRIKMLEIKMNRRKQQNQQASQQDINSLNAMVKKLLHMLAQINTYQYFQITNEPFHCVNGPYFNQMCNNHFESLIKRFITQLHIKRIQRLQRLQHLQSLQRVNNFINDSVDFQIWN